MITISPGSRQPQREQWSLERLVHERSIALGLAIDESSHITYTSALNSYLTFCKLHKFPIEPTEETLSFFTVYMSSYIKPDSVNSYLSGICNQLEPYFPNVRNCRKSSLVSRSLAGCRRRFGSPIKRKRPLSKDDLNLVALQLGPSPSHNDKLFLSMITTGFAALLRTQEMAFPDNKNKQNYQKTSLRHTVVIQSSQYSFLLPAHKADRFFEGNTIIITSNTLPSNPHLAFTQYLASRDFLHPLKPELWLRQSGQVPTRSWFIHRLRHFFPTDIGGQSMRAGGATALAEDGVLPHMIQAIGRWASNTFQIYIRKNPILLQALLFGHPCHQTSASSPTGS
jgi:hypothetical protein